MEQFSNHPLYRSHDIESAFSSLWQFYKKKFIVLFIFSFLVSFLLQYLSLAFNFNELQTITDPEVMMEKFQGFVWPVIIVLLINLFFTIVLHYYVLYNPLDSDTTILSSFYKSLKYIIPSIILMILFVFFASAAAILGLLALIIGVFFTMLYVCTLGLFLLPLLMVEGPDIGNAISRSFKLTHRNFWSNMGWVALFILSITVMSVILSSLVMLPFTGKFLEILTNPGETTDAMDFLTNPFYLILMSLVKALFFPLMPIFASILYFNGKAGEEENSLAASENEDQRPGIDDLYSKPRSDENQ